MADQHFDDVYDQDDPFNAPGAGVTPPSAPADVEPPAKRPNWPLVVGITSLVLGAMGALGSVSSIATVALSSVLQNSFTGFLPPEQLAYFELQFQVQSDYLIPSIAVSSLHLLLAIALIVAGILACSRKPSTRTTHLAWAVAKVPVVIAAVAVPIAVLNETNARAADQNITIPPGTDIATIAGVGFNTIWALAYMIFIAAWFLFPSVKRDCENMREPA